MSQAKVEVKPVKKHFEVTFAMGKSFAESAQLVLENHYTKGGAAYRFFTGCWNRKNIPEVDAIITDIKDKKLVEAEAIMKALDAIKVANEDGTLSDVRKFLAEKNVPVVVVDVFSSPAPQ